jgi:hypothetical protein
LVVNERGRIEVSKYENTIETSEFLSKNFFRNNITGCWVQKYDS